MKRFGYAAKLLISVGGVCFVFHKYDLSGLFGSMLAQNRALLAVSFLFVIAQIVVAAVRWYLVLCSLRLLKPLGLVVRIFYGTAFLNTFLPAGIAGDVVRIWLVRDNPGGVVTAINSVLIDRIITLLALSLIAMSVQPLIWLRFGNSIMFAANASFLALIIAPTFTTMFIAPLIAARTPWLMANRLIRMVQVLGSDLRRVFFDLPTFSLAFIAAVASNLLIIAAVFVMARGQAISIDFLECLVAIPVVLLITALPISIGGWGTREIAMVYMLGLFGVPAEQATALSINFGLCATLAGMPGALIWLTLRQRTARVEAG